VRKGAKTVVVIVLNAESSWDQPRPSLRGEKLTTKINIAVLNLFGGILVCSIFSFEPSVAHGGTSGTGGFNATEMKVVQRLLDRYGVVVLNENKPNGMPASMTLAVRVNAPRKVTFSVFEKPENFYYISTLFKENEVHESHGNSKAYTWASRHKLFSFVGSNVIDLYPPRRADVSIVRSSMGSGKFRVNFYEDGPDKTILVISGILDVQSSEWLIRYMIGNNPSMRQAMNVAIGLIMVKGAKAMAEGQALGKPLGKHRTRGKREGPLRPLGDVEFKRLEPLLKRGTVVLARSVRGGRLRQAIAVERVNAPAAKFIAAAGTPEFYPKMVKAISEIKVHERTEKAMEFSWTIGFSVFGLTSRNRITYNTDGVTIKGLDGSLAGAEWRWQVKDSGPNSCVVAYHGWADITKTGFILEKSMKREPYLEHGFVAGSNMVMLRAVRRVVEKK
jgi:ribosome-associated toxin RatA of RatAB toxin-antitoxin module